ncbi:MAG: MFS transporter [Lautropia sp.]
MPERAARERGWRIFAILASGYLMSYGLRAINATIAPELVAELGLSNAALGSLTSAYFVGFSLMQVPVGIWIDRYGPRRVDATLIAVASLACCLIGLSTHFVALWLARALMGAGFAAALMASFAMFRLWFPASQQGRLAAWVMMVGTAGVMIATVPARAAIPVLGWRGLFFVCAAVLGLVSVAMWFGLPKSREPVGVDGQPFLRSLVGYREVFRRSYFWRMVLMASAVQGGFISLHTLWIGPWFTRVLGLSAERAADSLFAFNLSLLAAYLVSGWFAPRFGTAERTTVRIAAVAVLLTVVAQFTIAAFPDRAGVAGWLLFAALSTVFTPLQARVALSFPQAYSGRALTAFNLVVFTSVIGVQTLVGVVLDALIGAGHPQAQAFRIGLAMLAGAQALVWLLFLAWPKLFPERAAPTVPG